MPIFISIKLETNAVVMVNIINMSRVKEVVLVIFIVLSKVPETVVAKSNRTYAKKQHWLLYLQ